MDTIEYVAIREQTTTAAVKFWRKELQKEPNRFVLKIRHENLANSKMKGDDGVTRDRMCVCGEAKFRQDHLLKECQ